MQVIHPPTMRVMSPDEQRQLLISFVLALLNDRASETPERKLLRELAEERHTGRGHTGTFLECPDPDCVPAISLLLKSCNKEVTFSISELKELSTKHRLSINASRMLGTVTARVEQQSIIAVGI